MDERRFETPCGHAVRSTWKSSRFSEIRHGGLVYHFGTRINGFGVTGPWTSNGQRRVLRCVYECMVQSLFEALMSSFAKYSDDGAPPPLATGRIFSKPIQPREEYHNWGWHSFLIGFCISHQRGTEGCGEMGIFCHKLNPRATECRHTKMIRSQGGCTHTYL